MQRQHFILNRLPIGVVTLDAQYRVSGYNGTASAIFGEDRLGAALGTTVYDLHPAAARGKIELLLRQADDADASGLASMLVNGPDRVLQLRVFRVKYAEGTWGYCLVLYDLGEFASTAVRDDEAELVAAQSLFKLPISTKDRIELLDVNQVVFLRAEGHYTQVHTHAERLFCNLSLSQLETRLPRDRFIRVHRSYIVNVARANAIRQRDDQFLILMGGHPEQDVPVSRGNVPRVRRFLGI